MQDATDLRQFYSSPLESIEEESMSDLAITKLRTEAAWLEAETATTALYKLTEMSRELLCNASLSIDSDSNFGAHLLYNPELGYVKLTKGVK